MASFRTCAGQPQGVIFMGYLGPGGYSLSSKGDPDIYSLKIQTH